MKQQKRLIPKHFGHSADGTAKTEIIHLRLTPDQKQQIREAAKANGLSISAHVLKRALTATAKKDIT